jgi:hypothetical protein
MLFIHPNARLTYFTTNCWYTYIPIVLFNVKNDLDMPILINFDKKKVILHHDSEIFED